MSEKKHPRKRGRKPRGPVPSAVPEEDIIGPRKFRLSEAIENALVGKLGLYLAATVAGAVALYLLGLAVMAAARPLLRIHEERQAKNLARLGGDYMSKGNWEAARMSAETSLGLVPENPEGLRLLAEIFEVQGRTGDAFEVYQRLGRSGYATLEEFKKFASIASQKGYTGMAEWLANWVGEQGEPDFPHLLRSSNLQAEGKNEEAQEALHAALAVSGSHRARRELARFLLANSEHGESNAEVHSLLAEISASPDEMGHEALVIGILSGVVPLDKRPDWLQRLRAHPLADEKSFAIADAVEVDADPSVQPRLVEEMVRRVYGKSLGDRMVAARWLLRHGESQRVLEILPLEQARGDALAFSLWIEARAAQGEWQAVLDAVAENPAPIAPLPGMLLHGQALKKTGNPEAARAVYLQALRGMEGDPAQVLPALSFLNNDGEMDIFRDNVRPLLANEEIALRTVQSIAPQIREAGDAAALRDFLQLAVEAGPLASFPALQNEIAHLDLVLGRQVDHTALEQRAANFPDNHAFRFTLALSELRQGRKAKALVIAETPKLRARDLAPEHQFILACVLAANGDHETAAKVAKLLAIAPLTRQERALLDEAAGGRREKL